MCERTRKTACKPRRATPKPQPGEKVVAVRCQPKTYPCPTCGRQGHRRHKYDRFVRSLAYGQALWLHVFYAEYTARCHCRKYFRSCLSGNNRNVRILGTVETSAVRTLSLRPLERLPPRVILGWTALALAAILAGAVGRIGLRSRATRAPAGRLYASGPGPLTGSLACLLP